jgi:hypothetical protein
MPQVQNVFAIVGFSMLDSVNEPNAAFVVPTLRPFADRVGAANSCCAGCCRDQLSCRHTSLRWNDRGKRDRAFRDPAALCHLPEPA